MSNNRINARQIRIRVAGATAGDARSMEVKLGQGTESDITLLAALRAYAKEIQVMKGYDGSDPLAGLDANMFDKPLWDADEANQLFHIYHANGSPELLIGGTAADAMKIESSLDAGASSASHLVQLDADHKAELVAGADNTSLEIQAAGGYGADVFADSSNSEAGAEFVGGSARAEIGVSGGSAELRIEDSSGNVVELKDGDIQADGQAEITGNIIGYANLQINDNGVFGGGLTAMGPVDFNSTLDVQGAVTLQSSLDVDGIANLDQIDVDGAADFQEPVIMHSTLGVSGALDLDGVADFAENVTMHKDLDVDGDTLLDKLTVGETASMQHVDIAAGADVAGGLVADTAKVSDLTIQDGVVYSDSDGELKDSNKFKFSIDASGAADLYLDGDLEVTGGISAGSLIIDQDEDQVLFMAADGTITSDSAYKFIGSGNTGKLDLDAHLEVQEEATFEKAVEMQSSLTVGATAVIAGNLYVNGSQFEVEGESVLFEDTLLEHGRHIDASGATQLNTTKDLGDLYHYDDSGSQKIAAIYFDNSDKVFRMAKEAVESSPGILGAPGSTGHAYGDLHIAALAASSAKVSDLTEDRIVFAGIGGELEDSDQLTFDGTKLYVGASASVDIDGMLDVAGTANLDVLDVDGAADFQEAVTMGKTLQVGQTASLLGALDVDGAADFQEAVTMGKTLSVGQTASLSGALSVAGRSDLAGILDVDGAADFQEAVTMHKTISVGQTASLLSDLSVTGNADLNGNLDVDGIANLDVLDVDGAADFQEAVTMNKTLSVGQTASLLGALDVDGAADFQEAVTMGKTLSVTGETTLQDKLIAEEASFSAAVDMNSTATLAGSLTLDGAAVADRLITSGASSMKVESGNLWLDSSGALKVDAEGKLELIGDDIEFDCHGATYAFNGCTSAAHATAIKDEWVSYVGDKSIIEAIIENAKGGKDMSMDIELMSNVDTVAGVAEVEIPAYDAAWVAEAISPEGHKVWKQADEAYDKLCDDGSFDDMHVFVNGQLMIRGKDFDYDGSVAGNERKLRFKFEMDSGDTISVQFPKIKA